MGPPGFKDVKWDDVLTRCLCGSYRPPAEHARLQDISISSATSPSTFYYSKFCFGHVNREVARMPVNTSNSTPAPTIYNNAELQRCPSLVYR